LRENPGVQYHALAAFIDIYWLLHAIYGIVWDSNEEIPRRFAMGLNIADRHSVIWSVVFLRNIQ
jgi:hypothetical protein